MLVIVGIIEYCTTDWTLARKAAMKMLVEALIALDKKMGQFTENSREKNFHGILVAPEFFFMNPYKNLNKGEESKAISETEKDEVVEKCQELSEKYRGILIVPGTIVWRKDLDKNSKKEENVNRRDKIKNKIEEGIYDISKDVKEELEKGKEWIGAFGKDKVDDLKNKIIKGYKYAMYNSAYVFLNGDAIYRYDKKTNFNEESHDEEVSASTVFLSGQKPNIVKIGKYLVGFEICADHSHGVLKHFATNTKLYEGKSGMDLHFLLAGSNDKYGNNVYLKDNGDNQINSYFIHADSINDKCGVFTKTWKGELIDNELKDFVDAELEARENYYIWYNKYGNLWKPERDKRDKIEKLIEKLIDDNKFFQNQIEDLNKQKKLLQDQDGINKKKETIENFLQQKKEKNSLLMNKYKELDEAKKKFKAFDELDKQHDDIKNLWGDAEAALTRRRGKFLEQIEIFAKETLAIICENQEYKFAVQFSAILLKD